MLRDFTLYTMIFAIQIPSRRDAASCRGGIARSTIRLPTSSCLSPLLAAKFKPPASQVVIVSPIFLPYVQKFEMHNVRANSATNARRILQNLGFRMSAQPAPCSRLPLHFAPFILRWFLAFFHSLAFGVSLIQWT